MYWFLCIFVNLYDYFKRVPGSIIFGIQTQVASKVSNTNSYVKKEICMSIFQTATVEDGA